MKLITKITDSNFLGGEAVYLSEVSRRSSRGVLLDNHGKVAMMYMSSIDLYKLPGGGIEDGESKEEAFLREILEETGYAANIIKELGYLEEHKCMNSFFQISYCYLAHAEMDSQKEVQLSDSEREIGFQLQWLELEKAIHIMNQSFHSCIQLSTKFMLERDKTILEEVHNLKEKH